MIGTWGKTFGWGQSLNYAALVKEGALILDVRTEEEFEVDHIEGSLNIPVEKLRNNLHLLADKQRVIIACCVSGAKSWYAKNLLDSLGFVRVYDAGKWTKLHRKIG